MKLTTPVAFLVFNRPQITARVDDFAPIRQCWHNSQPLLANVDRTNT
jgi:hypothetical protein